MINRKYLPSKRFLAALGVAVAVILITILINEIKPSAQREAYDLSAINSTSSAQQMDSDNDGLPDWEEALYGTDPHNPDTDGDGTLDGEEIQEGRDPLKPNTAAQDQTPDDKISPNLIAESQAIASVDQNINATQKMAQDLMSNIIAAQPISGTIDPDTVNNLVQQSIQDLPQKQFAGTTTAADLDLIPIASDAATAEKDLTTYANEYYVLTDAFERIMGQDMAIVNDSMANHTNLNAKKMQTIVSVYQHIASDMTALALPATPESSGAEYHLEIINDLQALAQIDNDIILSSADADTASVYADISAYSDTINDLTGALDTMDAILGIKR